MYATAYLDEKGIKKAGKSKEVSPEEKIATLEKKVKSLSSKKMMLYSDYKDDKLTREEYVKRSKAMVEQIDELHQEIEQLKTEIPPEDNFSSKFETQLENIINMESFNREKIQKVIKKVIIAINSRWERENGFPEGLQRTFVINAGIAVKALPFVGKAQ